MAKARFVYAGEEATAFVGARPRTRQDRRKAARKRIAEAKRVVITGPLKLAELHPDSVLSEETVAAIEAGKYVWEQPLPRNSPRLKGKAPAKRRAELAKQSRRRNRR